MKSQDQHYVPWHMLPLRDPNARDQPYVPWYLLPVNPKINLDKIRG